MSEVWKKIPGFHNRYSVSSRGRVRNDENGYIRKPNKMSKGVGYLTVGIKCGGKAHTLYIHHLVAAAFLGPTPEGQEIRHRNGDVDNNDATNLLFGTRAENLADKQVHGTQTRGERYATAKLTEEQVIEIRRLRDNGSLVADLSSQFSVAPMTISKIINRKTWAHLS